MLAIGQGMCYHEEKSVAPQVAEQRKDAKGNMTDTFFIVGIVLMVIGYFLFFQAQSLRTTEQRKKLERMSRTCSMTAGLAFQALTLSLLVIGICFCVESNTAPGVILLIGALGAQYVALGYYQQQKGFVRYKYKKSPAVSAPTADPQPEEEIPEGGGEAQ